MTPFGSSPLTCQGQNNISCSPVELFMCYHGYCWRHGHTLWTSLLHQQLNISVVSHLKIVHKLSSFVIFAKKFQLSCSQTTHLDFILSLSVLFLQSTLYCFQTHFNSLVILKHLLSDVCPDSPLSFHFITSYLFSKYYKPTTISKQPSNLDQANTFPSSNSLFYC